MEPQFVFRDAFNVMGVQERVDNTDPKFYHTLWMDRYMPYDERVKPLSIDKAYYSIYFAIDQQEYCLDGMAVSAGTLALDGLVLRAVPTGRYAAFECTVDSIGATWHHIFAEWLPKSPYIATPEASSFEFYPPDTETDRSPVTIYLPVSDKTS